ncbi:MAG: c-type cytochrome [Bdellovibrionales bacterium]|nr:c-type cytochrome [Bdellovibrionales bacterium]
MRTVTVFRQLATLLTLVVLTERPTVAQSPGEELFYGSNQCAFCHALGAGDRPSGPDLAGVSTRRSRDWLTQWLADPEQFAERDMTAAELVAKYNGVVMPKPSLTATEVQHLIDFFTTRDSGGTLPPSPFEPLPAAQYESAKAAYFDNCSGCHGARRWGATGPSLLPESHVADGKQVPGAGTRAIGTTALSAILQNGSPAGMPAWGREGLLNAKQIEELARFIQMEPPRVPPFTLSEADDQWELIVPPVQRPTSDQTNGASADYIGVILRDIGQVAIVNGVTKNLVTVLDTGKAVHILRTSKSGRYLYAIGRDGRLALIDLWYPVPKIVARVRTCWDARSVDASKAQGFEDKYAIVGCYSPSQYAIVDGTTLKPLSITSTADSTDWSTCDRLPEIRIAAIVASETEPYWIVALKESGWVYFVDYSDPLHPKETRLRADNFLHDGGWAQTEGPDAKRYFMIAANAKNKVCVVDTKERQVLSPCIDVGKIPHPGRGANFIHPTYGPVWATAHIGEGRLTMIGVDPRGHPHHAWKVVETVSLTSSGSLFLKSHPKSRNVWIDFPLSAGEGMNGQVAVYTIDSGEVRYLKVSDQRTVHMEYNKAGDEVWISGWLADEIYVYDDKTLTLKKTISGSWLKTPTGKFNVFNTAHDIY